mmetsp:Transcript_117237/g.378342  ORF Transcript_117237/g.378342 Transcript_117237/m.378342 type:complete len:89 (-) Transcript_117237:99-365(-)
MLDLITLFSAVGLQQEMKEANRDRKANLIIRDDEGQGSSSSMVEEAAEHLSSVFDSFEGAVSKGIGSLLGTSQEAAPAAVPAKVKKVA